jgi:proteasome-associated ATPase
MPHDKKEIELLLERMINSDHDPESIMEMQEFLHTIRTASEDAGSVVDSFFINTLILQRKKLHSAQRNVDALKGELGNLTFVPYHVATFLTLIHAAERPEAVVHYGNSRRIVSIDSSITPESLVSGEDVFLVNELNMIRKKSPEGSLRCGSIGTFEEHMEGGRMLIQFRDEKIVVEAVGPIREDELRAGDIVHFDRQIKIAFEKIGQARETDFFLGDAPVVKREDVGGQSENLDRLWNLIDARVVDPEGASAYGLSGSSSILLCGPPGTGKTLIAQHIACRIFELTGKQCGFAVVKPGEWESPWVGETQARIRSTFSRLSAEAEIRPVCVFLDEIEAIGRTRGGISSHHSDRFVAALLAELDGFVALGKVIVISATNRKDMIEPALLERLTADGEFYVNRPDMKGATEIFGIHLPLTLPYTTERLSMKESREAIIDMAVSRLFSSNGVNNQICELTFRNGEKRIIEAHELVSGRMIKQICKVASGEAFMRKQRGGEPGLCVRDMDKALSLTMDSLRRKTLTPRNAHEHISGLPQDKDIVSVRPIYPEGISNKKRLMVLDVA